MPALVGKGINNVMIDDACTFLSGPCSCQVKRQNPGFDILTSVNWDELLEEQIQQLDNKAMTQVANPDQTGATDTSKGKSPLTSKAAPIDLQDRNKEETAATPSPFLGWIIWGPAAILGAGILILLLGRKKA